MSAPRIITLPRMTRASPALLALVLLASGCKRDAEPTALGTLEWDRIELVAEAAEPIVEIAVREGEAVAQGALVARLDDTRLQSEAAAAEADAGRWRAVLSEQRAGARAEELDEARA